MTTHNNPFIHPTHNYNMHDVDIDIFDLMEKVKKVVPKKYHKGIRVALSVIDNSCHYEDDDYETFVYIDHNKFPNMKNDIVVMNEEGKFVAEYKGYCYGTEGKCIGFYSGGIHSILTDEAVNKIPEEELAKLYQIETYINNDQKYHNFNNSAEFHQFMNGLIKTYGKKGTNSKNYNTTNAFI